MRSQFFAIASARTLSAVLQALVGIGLARSIGPGPFGEITAVAGVLVFLFIVCGYGMSSYLGRARALQHDAEVSTALLLNNAGSTLGVVAAITPILLGLLPLSAGPILALLVVGTAFDKNTDAALAVLIADGERMTPSANVVLRRAVTAVCFFLALAAGFDPIVSYCVASCAGPALGQVHVTRELSRRGVSRRRAASVRGVLGTSTAFALNDIAIQSRSLDVAIVAVAASPGVAGLYSGAVKLIAPSELVASTLAGVVLPRASLMTRKQTRSTALKLIALAVALLVPMAPAALFATPIAVFVLGSEFQGAGEPLGVLLLTLPFILLGTPIAALLQASQRERLVAVNSIVFAIIFPCSVLLGAVLGGAVGAAWGVVIARALNSLTLVCPLLRRA